MITTAPATESPPKSTKPPAPVPKILTLTKPPEGKWKLVMSGPIRRADINHLRRFLQIEYIRAKKAERKALNAQARKDQINATES